MFFFGFFCSARLLRVACVVSARCQCPLLLSFLNPPPTTCSMEAVAGFLLLFPSLPNPSYKFQTVAFFRDIFLSFFIDQTVLLITFFFERHKLAFVRLDLPTLTRVSPQTSL